MYWFSLEITDPPRYWTKKQWKDVHRYLRICKSQIIKNRIAIDDGIYGDVSIDPAVFTGLAARYKE